MHERMNESELEKALQDSTVYEQLFFSVQVYKQRHKLPDYLVDYHTAILKRWGILESNNDKENDSSTV